MHVADSGSDEVGKRYSFFYILGCVASAFAGILAFGLMQMSGLGNLRGWRCTYPARFLAGHRLNADSRDLHRRGNSYHHYRSWGLLAPRGLSRLSS